MTDRHALVVMRAVLSQWGSICELSRNWNGYPTSDTTHRAAFGRGGGSKRLPIPNIPSFAILTSREVMRLPDDEANAITVWYAHQFNAQGTWLTPEQKALLLRINVHTLRWRERHGRERLLTQSPNIIDAWQSWQDSREDVALAQKVS